MMSEKEKRSLNLTIESLKRDSEFWKSQFMRLVDILIEGKELTTDIINHLKK